MSVIVRTRFFFRCLYETEAGVITILSFCRTLKVFTKEKYGSTMFDESASLEYKFSNT